MSEAERGEIRDGWNAMLAQYQKSAARDAWLYDNQDHPDFDELHAKAQRSGERFGELRDALAACCAVPAAAVTELLTAVLESETADV